MFKINFTRPSACSESECIISLVSQGEAIENYQNAPDNFNAIFETAKIVWKDIVDRNNLNFNRYLDGFDLPRSLESLLRRIIEGPK